MYISARSPKRWPALALPLLQAAPWLKRGGQLQQQPLWHWHRQCPCSQLNFPAQAVHRWPPAGRHTHRLEGRHGGMGRELQSAQSPRQPPSTPSATHSLLLTPIQKTSTHLPALNRDQATARGVVHLQLYLRAWRRGAGACVGTG